MVSLSYGDRFLGLGLRILRSSDRGTSVCASPCPLMSSSEEWVQTLPDLHVYKYVSILRGYSLPLTPRLLGTHRMGFAGSPLPHYVPAPETNESCAL